MDSTMDRPVKTSHRFTDLLVVQDEHRECRRCGVDLGRSALVTTITVRQRNGDLMFIGSARERSAQLCSSCGLMLASWILSGRDGEVLPR